MTTSIHGEYMVPRRLVSSFLECKVKIEAPSQPEWPEDSTEVFTANIFPGIWRGCYNIQNLGFRPPVMGNARTAVQLLHQNGTDIEAKCKSGETVLHCAARYGYTDIVQHLLELGADSNVAKKDGLPPLYPVAEDGHVAITKSLIENGTANVNAGSDSGWKPLHVAAGEGYQGVVEVLVENGTNVGAQSALYFMPLLVATTSGELEAVKLLLEYGASLELRTKDGKMALHVAAGGRRKIFDLLVEMGANANAKDNDDLTPSLI
ncbi:uncharacterized protein DFL_004384 [Arthrobotrys flagrans]|uniref:Uncharacterized protein n=1 Tax=Arthrobotrys flagrans TaxID=97331 RepID=A0A437A4W9_ARTFL|nr:hypothetical protein DFL_004384 [Arthrobotrys flagrans]